MAYDKPKLIDLNNHFEKGYGQQMNCTSGSGAVDECENGITASTYCRMGSTAEFTHR